MATVKRHRDKWQAQIYVMGKRESKSFRIKNDAIHWAHERERELRASITGHGRTVYDLLQRYRELSARKKGAKWEVTRLERFERDLGKIPLSDLSTDHISRWRDFRLESGVTGATVRREMVLLGHALETARKEWGWIAVNPSKDVRKPQDGRPRNQRFTQDEIDKLVVFLRFGTDSVSGRTAAIFLFAIETAMRCGEICALRPGDIKGKVAHISDSKTGESRDVPLSPKALELWAQYPDGFDLSPMQVSTSFRRAKNHFELDTTFHDSRREATSRLAKIFTLLELAKITGHKNPKQLLTYYEHDAAALAERL